MSTKNDGVRIRETIHELAKTIRDLEFLGILSPSQITWTFEPKYVLNFDSSFSKGYLEKNYILLRMTIPIDAQNEKFENLLYLIFSSINGCLSPILSHSKATDSKVFKIEFKL